MDTNSSYTKNEGKQNGTSNRTIGFDAQDQPYIVTISGHFSAGKSNFYDSLVMQMGAKEVPLAAVINYKGRSPRATELLGVDYYPIDSDQKFQQLVQDGTIAVPYKHRDINYGLSKNFVDAVRKGSVPVMITDGTGITNLKGYLTREQLNNKLVSFMLHTCEGQARERLFERAGHSLSDDEVREIKVHYDSFKDELALYRQHEYLFRHVLRNNTVEGVSKQERIKHLTDRAMQILDLEGRLEHSDTAEDFREAYVGQVVNNIFGVQISDLLKTRGQRPRLQIPTEEIDRYSREHKIEVSTLRRLTNKDTVGTSSHYGVVSVFIEGIRDDEEKRILADLVERVAGLSPQYKKTYAHLSSRSKYSLSQVSGRRSPVIDFLISFSPYDPMRIPDIDARPHTLAIELVSSDRRPQIEPIPFEEAKRIVEGNGTSS